LAANRERNVLFQYSNFSLLSTAFLGVPQHEMFQNFLFLPADFNRQIYSNGLNEVNQNFLASQPVVGTFSNGVEMNQLYDDIGNIEESIENLNNSYDSLIEAVEGLGVSEAESLNEPLSTDTEWNFEISNSLQPPTNNSPTDSSSISAPPPPPPPSPPSSGNNPTSGGGYDSLK
jgi:hypothetical protein